MHKNCLIAGPTNAGKTLLSRRLAEAHGFSRISGDALVLAFQESYPELKIGHTVEGLRVEDAYDVTCRQFGRFLVRFLNALAWESAMPYVLDTFHVRPEDLAGIDTRKTQVLFLGYPEVEAREKARQAREYQLASVGAASGWLASEAEAEERFEIFIGMSREYREECSRLGYRFFDVSQDFARALGAAAKLAVSQEKLYEEFE